MPFARPTLSALRARSEQQVASHLGLGGLLRRSRLGALARAIAGSSHELHGHLDWTYRQVFADTADAEHLVRWASIWGLQRLPATAWEGMLRFAGVDGSIVPEGTVLQRDDGARYETLELGTIASGTADVPVRAEEVGSGPSVDAGVLLALVSPVAGVQSQAEVLEEGLTAGTDEESDDRLRERVLVRIAEHPHGGAAHDYLAWVREVAGVGATRAWVFPLFLGPGTVGVTFAVDDSPDGPIPTVGDVDLVQAYLDLVRPVTAQVTVYGPTPRAIDATIALDPDSFDLRELVVAALEDLLRREGGPGETLLISHVREAISTTRGERDHTLVEWDGEEPADVELGPSELAELGEITWV